METLIKIFGEGIDLNVLQMSCRGVVIFILALILIRISGTRSFGLKKPLDNIVVILLGAVLSRAVVGASPFIPIVVASFVIVLLHRLCSWVSIHNRTFSRLVNGEKVLILKDGVMNKRNMDKCLVSEEDLREQVRLKAQAGSLDKIKEVYMERSGEISAVKKEDKNSQISCRKKKRRCKSLPNTNANQAKKSKMVPQPVYDDETVRGSGKLNGKVALITGGDSGIGRAVAVLFAKEGADVAISYLSETDDAKITKDVVEKYGRKCLLIPGDVSRERHCITTVTKTLKAYGKIDILVNNAGVHYESETMEDITTEHLLHTFQTNIFSFFWITKAALVKMEEGSCIINTASVTAYRGSGHLIDYSATKGAIVAFTRSLSATLAEKGIRVNAVAPGPIWTPLIPSSFKAKDVAKQGSNTPLKRAGQPVEVAPCYLFLACNEDSSYMTGQVLHPNGGEIING